MLYEVITASGGFLSHGELKQPMEFSALLNSNFWRRGSNFIHPRPPLRLVPAHGHHPMP